MDALESDSLKLLKLSVVGDREAKGPDGSPYTLYALDVLWGCEPEGQPPFELLVEVERRYSEFYSLYYDLEKCCAVSSEFPRRVLYGSTWPDVVAHRRELFAGWVKAVCSDSAARQSSALREWLRVDSVLAFARTDSCRPLAARAAESARSADAAAGAAAAARERVREAERVAAAVEQDLAPSVGSVVLEGPMEEVADSRRAAEAAAASAAAAAEELRRARAELAAAIEATRAAPDGARFRCEGRQ
eukprot:TRINITY_DN4598_c0_g1_i1.p1 TRINITY_DN4598_c0_g1~~TRINITY_DN4598_c0_g1_i1.p1  ORF type:complete len:246 (+),score=81.80 TRINITY_DN4598_c0_g1_i1:51-788(+)